MKTFLTISTFCLFAFNGFGQLNISIDTLKYRLAKTIFQNGCTLKFWNASVTEAEYNVLLERRDKGKRNVFEMELAINGGYLLADKNQDGFLDFVTNYHGYDIVYLFNTFRNRFEEKPVYISEITSVLNKRRKIFWSYREAQYSDHRSFSLLYRFRGNALLQLYKLVYVTKEDYDDKPIRIDLYRMVGDKERFVKTIETKHPARFRYKDYWWKNYAKLLGYR